MIFLFLQSKSNSELKAMFDVHYRFLLLLSGPMATLQAAVPKMLSQDGESGILYCMKTNRY